MGRYDRSIKIAYDKATGEILDAEEIFHITKDAFQIRKKYHEKTLMLSCCECEQDLIISGSKYDRLHFKHKPGHEYCILADGKLTPHEHKAYTENLRTKECDRHKELKNKIGELLRTVPDIDKDSISIDNKFIVKEYGKRKPDVYCKFKNEELVFEIQLSDLSLGYILSRCDFYKENGIYLIWILDDFDIYNQGTLERDIKYLSKYENFFRLDENSNTFKLECEYKFVLSTNDNEILTKWVEKSVSLYDLKFDSKVFQVFFYDFGENKTMAEKLQKERIKECERRIVQEIKQENAERKVNDLISRIAEFRRDRVLVYDTISNDIHGMTDFEIKTLNRILSLEGKIINGKTPLIKWIDNAKKHDVCFLEFILKTKEIKLDINKNDNLGRSPLQAIFQNNTIHSKYLILALFQAGYRLTKNDNLALLEFLKQQLISDEEFYIIKTCDNLTNRELVPIIYHFSKLIFIIESAHQEKLITFNFTGNKRISFANNAIQYYNEYWEYIELAFKKFGLWDKLIQLDTKFTFRKKVEQFYMAMPKQKYDFDEVFKDLYPELN